MEVSRRILKQYWGFDQFRPHQLPIIHDCIQGNDILALLPTGGGKSICFQVPGIIRKGITIVISPLIALMQDQVLNLKSKGIRAELLAGEMSHKEIDMLLDNARFGGLDFLYTSPERIQSTLFIERFKRMEVGLIVIDEAHCISQWGHDFRPSFLDIGKLREFQNNTPVIALTATATQKVQEDIIHFLGLKKVKIHESSFERKNLSFKSYLTDNKINRIIEYCLERPKESGIIYGQTRKSVQELAKQLSLNKINVGFYHGGLDNINRKTMLEKWLSGEINVMVATNAFGMGIDKSDVRFVIHFEPSSTLEAYIQEAGRAGRDEMPANCIIFWSEKDVQELLEKIEKQFPPKGVIEQTYQSLCNYLNLAVGSGKNEVYPIDIRTLCQRFNLNINEAYHSFKLLEQNGNLTFSESVYHPTRIKIAIGNLALYNFQIQHPTLSPLIELLTRSYPGIFERFNDIHENEISKRLDLNQKELNNALKFLEKNGIIDISWQTSLPTVTFTTERKDNNNLKISPEIYHERKHLAKDKAIAVQEFLRTKTCRSAFLLAYFGQKGSHCLICDTCLRQSSINEGEKRKAELLNVLSVPLTLNEIQTALSIEIDELKEILRKLLLDELIQKQEDGKFCKK